MNAIRKNVQWYHIVVHKQIKDSKMFSLNLTEGQIMSVKGSICAETALRWLTGFIVNDEDTCPLRENLLALWALVGILMHSSIAPV